MCGIAGILSGTGTNDYLIPLAQRMQTALQHRGPDDRGIYIASDRQMALIHTRLAILDLSPAGHQPMSTVDGRYWITFNGEIYNFRQLRQSLESQGERFQSQSDTEVILKLYQSLGKRCVEPLRGMFAFAIWDDLEQTCFIARDPLGIKPLYYWRSGSTLVFASELRAILASGLPKLDLSTSGLYGYLINGSVPEPYTLIEGVHCLPAGHWLQWQPEQITQPQQYWQIHFTPDPTLSLSEATTKVRAALLDSIQHHFVSDVPVGAFLSGGIDSTSVVALARQSQPGQLRTFSIAFAESAWNEGAIAAKVAQQFETDHTECIVTADMAKQLFPKFLETLDQPSVDGFNTFCVSQVAHQNHTKVVLSGLGGDELFGGYPSFRKVPQMAKTLQHLKVLAPLTRIVGGSLELMSPSPQWRRLGDFLQQPPSLFSAYRSLRGIFSHREACRIVNHYLPDRPSPGRFVAQVMPQLPSLEDGVSFLELSQYMRNQLLRDSDVMSMAWGLELRVPLVDHILLETIASIPSPMRLAAGKRLLIQSVPELPDWVVNRPKQGFYFPFQVWLDQDWHDCFRHVPTFKNLPLKNWYRRWSLALLEDWLQRTIGSL